MRIHLLPLLAIIFTTLAERNECPKSFTICQPPDATTDEVPKIGDDAFLNLYSNILNSHLPTFTTKRSTTNPQTPASLCCVSSLSCLTVANLGIPFCYDKYTTNYYLPDSSYGTLSTGTYNSSNGDTTNLQTGDYIKRDGLSGNIYSVHTSLIPNTAMLPIPSQWTSRGIGSAIPASALGGKITRTYTTTILGTTVPATTVSASTVTTSVEGDPGSVTLTLGPSVQEPRTFEQYIATVTTTEVLSATSPGEKGNARSRVEAPVLGLIVAGGLIAWIF